MHPKGETLLTEQRVYCIKVLEKNLQGLCTRRVLFEENVLRLIERSHMLDFVVKEENPALKRKSRASICL